MFYEANLALKKSLFKQFSYLFLNDIINEQANYKIYDLPILFPRVATFNPFAVIPPPVNV